MSRYVLFEDAGYADLLPLVYWRSVFELNSGRTCLMDRIAQRLGRHPAGIWTRDWVASVASHRCQLPVNEPLESGSLLVNGRWLSRRPIELRSPPFVGRCDGAVVYVSCDDALARRLSAEVMLDPDRCAEALDGLPSDEYVTTLIRYPWDLVSCNRDALETDWRPGDCALDGEVSTSALLLRPDSVHVGERSRVRPTAVLDAEQGSIYISSNVTISPHCYIAGPVYIGPGTVIKPHTSIGNGTTIGPACRVGGEVNNCIICGYTHKEHAGYLGRSFVGNWVDIGPGSSNTDQKSTYGPIRVGFGSRVVETGLSECGAFVGDHVRLGTNQMIPNGAVIGFAASAAAGRFLPKFLPSFSWYTDSGLASGDPVRLLETARRAMATRHFDMTEGEIELFRRLWRLSDEHEQ